ncbi:hypothetical protein [Pelagicoccus mobilis]|uniref:DUF1579 domain-containing protein n=1 Tax=Pelagicoccus mobilis TaxID=415221 RepID=A0A934S0M4_9BACT|nr:hypothetical protein [Pelagicoccus mobilis]MBK1878819.1 hypothetical protein [Pelagicoccus mobilis]
MKQTLQLALLLLFSTSLSANEATLHPKLEPFRPILGITYSGEFAQSTPDKPVIDVVRNERILNGQAIRSVHSLNNGAYGGETIYRWDEEKQRIVYHYFTTQGFMTTGTFKLQDGVFTAFEEVTGAANGIVAVRSSGSFTPEKMTVKSEYQSEDGSWTPGHTATYTPTPEAEIVFK